MGRSKTVLIAMDSLTCGGGEKSLTSMLPFLISAGCDVTLALEARGGVFEKLVPPEVKITSVRHKKSNSISDYIRRILYRIRIRLPWNRHLHRAEFFWQAYGSNYIGPDDVFDVAIGYQQGFSTYFIADHVKARKKICWINADIEASRHLVEYCRRYYALFDNIVTPSAILKEKLATTRFIKYPDRLVCINDIVNESVIRNLANKYTPFNNDGRFHITSVGRLVKEKGYHLAIAAARMLADAGIDFCWHIVGDGSLRNQLSELISSLGLMDHIILEGQKENPYPYIKHSDIFVQTSVHEGFGITIAEAKVLDKPIVCTDFPVVFDQLQNRVNGIIVGMEPRLIADAIIELYKNDDLRRSLECQLKSEVNSSTVNEATKLVNLVCS